MLGRVLAITANTYREAVRARVLFALLAVAVAAALSSIAIAAMSLRQEMRIVADIGSSITSFAAVATTIVLGATSLYREVELKTVFPILTRKLRRHEYLVGKYLGILATLLVFIAIDGGVTLGILAVQAKQHLPVTIGSGVASLALLGYLLWRASLTRSFVVLPWSLAFFLAMALLAADAGPERQIVLVSAALTLAEVALIAAIATLFSSFSSPFLTAIFTLMFFVIGRSADTLANIPARVFGTAIHYFFLAIAYVVPNLDLYVPARPLLLGQLPDVSLASYVARAWMNSLLYAAVLLAVSALIFRKRDFQ